MVVRGRFLVAVVTVAAVLTASAGSSAVAAASSGVAAGERGVMADAAASVRGGEVLASRRARVTMELHAAQRRDGAVIRDISYSAGGGPAVRAYLVEPDGSARPRERAGVLYLHWFHPGDPTSSRLEFV